MRTMFVVISIITLQQTYSYCRDVKKGNHYYDGHSFVPKFVNAEMRQITVTFENDTTKYVCDCKEEPYPGCMYSWSKLWGSSRCGYTHSHHKDSDRFVWRRQILPDGITPGSGIEIAAYSYDDGVKPYDPPNANLLQSFSTILQPNVAYTLKLDLSDPSNTIYELNSSNIRERKVVKHANNCSSARKGYELSLYFGGQCTAPSTVTVCYTNESSSN